MKLYTLNTYNFYLYLLWLSNAENKRDMKIRSMKNNHKKLVAKPKIFFYVIF